MWLRSLLPKKCQHLWGPDRYLGTTDNITITTNQYTKENTLPSHQSCPARVLKEN